MKQEMLGIRCGKLSERHRAWGECYMADIDHIVTDMTAVEYDNRKAVALIEYKYYSNSTDLNCANIAAIEDLANRASLPFFVVQYDAGDWEFLVRPRNEQARVFVPKRTWMSESDYVCLLHRLRGKDAPTVLLDKLRGGAQAEQDESEIE